MKFGKFAARLMVVSATLGLAVGLPGEERDVEQSDRVEALEEFEVIGSDGNVFTTPGSGIYVGEEMIDALQLDDVNRILRKAPGVYIREEEGYGLFPNISLRGVDTTRNGKLTVMEDGVLTAPATYSAPSAYYAPSAGRMFGIEVLKGSSQIRYGPHSTGGAINYLSTPVPKDERAGLLRLAYGSDEEVRFTGRFGGLRDTEMGAIGYLLEGYYRYTGGFKRVEGAGSFAGSDDTGFERSDYMFKGSWEPNTTHYHYFEFKIGYTDLHADEGYLGLSTDDFRQDPYRRYAASRSDRIDTNHTRVHLRHLLEPNERIKITSTVYYSKFHRNWFKLHDIRDIDIDGDGIPEGSEPGGTRVGEHLGRALAGAREGRALEVLEGRRAGKLRVRANNRDYAMAGFQTALDYHFAAGETTHELEVGMRLHYDRIRRFQWHHLMVQDSEGDFIDDIRSANGSDGNRRQRARAFSTYIDDRISFGSWKLVPGLRYERINYEYTDFTTDGTNQPSADGESDLDFLAPGISGTFQGSDNWLLFAGYHKGFSVPSPRNHARKGIREERSHAFELGTRFNDRNALFGEVVLFHTRFDDLIVIDNIGGAGTGDSENVGRVDSTGIELMLGIDPGRRNDWGFSNPYTLSVTYTDAALVGDANSEDEESIFAGGRDGNRVPYIPEFQVNLTAGIETEKVRAYLSASFVDDRFTSATNSEVEINPNTGRPDSRFGKIDSYLTVDLSTYYRLTEKLELFATVTNLTDEVYMASRHPHGPRPGSPRMAFAGVHYRF